MAVNIEFALFEERLIHISNRLSKDKIYNCPSCKEALTPKKGPIITHHFAHKPDSSCNASKETLLHLFAKHILVTETNNILFQFPITLFQQSQELRYTLSKYIDFNYINIPLDDVFDFLQSYEPEGKAEQSIGEFVADVMFFDSEQGYEDLVVEVFVTHAIEDNKRNYFNQIKFPYIEVKPIMNNDEIIFIVSETNMTDFIQKIEADFANDLINLTYTNLKNELFLKVKDNIVDEEKIEIAKSHALDFLINEINNINLRDYVDRKLYEDMSTIPATATNSFDRVEKVKHTKLVRGKKPHMLCNGIYVNYETGILRSLIDYCLKEQIDIEAFVEHSPHYDKDGITGFNFRLPRNTITGDVMKDILREMVLNMKN